MNLTYANCAEHGRTLFGKRPRRRVMTCMICDRPVSVDGADVHIKEVKRQRKHNRGISLFADEGAAVVAPKLFE